MSKSSNAFKRGLTYHAGAGIGEAIRLVTTTGAGAAIGVAVHYATGRIDELKMHRDIQNHLRKK